MKKIVVLFFSLLIVFSLESCKEYDFLNPWDPGATLKAPSGFTVAGYADTSILFTWHDNSNDEANFVIEEFRASTGYKELARVPANAEKAVVPYTMHRDSTCKFRIRAVNFAIQGQPSQEVPFNSNSRCLTDTKVTAIVGNTLQFAWNDTISINHTIDLRVSTDGITYKSLSTYTSQAHTASLPFSLDPSQVYYFVLVRKSGSLEFPAKILTVAYKKEIFFGGDCVFSTTGGSSQNFVGLLDGSWNKHSIQGQVNAISPFNNNVCIGGAFTTCDSTASGNFSSCFGTSWKSITKISSTVNCLQEYHKQLYLGGKFNVIQSAGKISADAGNKTQKQSGRGPYLRYLTGWDGSSWNTLATGVDGSVNALAIFNDKLIVGGDFTSADGYVVNHIAQWDGSAWQPMGMGFNGSVKAIANFYNELYAAGDFTLATGAGLTAIAKWNGAAWVGVATISSGSVNSLMVFNGKLYIGGNFTLSDGTAACLASWDGTNWYTFSNLSGSVNSLAADDQYLYVGGNYTSGNSVESVENLAKFDGALWLPVVLVSGTVNAIKPMNIWMAF